MQDTEASRAFLLAAVAVGVLAMVLAWAYLQNAATSIAANAPKVQILIAKQDLFPSQTLDPDRDLIAINIPEDFKSWRDLCLKPEFKNSYRGQRVNRRIAAPQPVMLADLQASADLEPKGDERLISIPVRGPAALGGNLIPGDWVKIFAIVGSIKAVPATQSATGHINVSWAQADLVVPEELKVIAIGTRLTKNRLQITEAAQLDAIGQAEAHQSVTLVVTEAQARRILEALGVSQTPLWLVMCPRKTPATAPEK